MYQQQEHQQQHAMLLRDAIKSQSRSPSPFEGDAQRFGDLEKREFHQPNITIEAIRQLHRVAVSGTRPNGSDPLHAGVLRGEFGPNEPRTIVVGGHTAVEKDLVMDRLKVLILWLNEEGAKYSAAKFACMAFYFFVKLHAFGDGNGRSGRLLISLILRRAGLRKRRSRTEQPLKSTESVEDAAVAEKPLIILSADLVV
uniref:Fido domain-containing protein n=1 Tax=Globodera rostochiensis TaxID=31243 RepID=A0A914HA16_GLORO